MISYNDDDYDYVHACGCRHIINLKQIVMSGYSPEGHVDQTFLP